MTKTRKALFSLILALAMAMTFSITAFAANPPTSGFHKCNGMGNMTGLGGEYYSTITKHCSKITVWGDSDGPNYKSVVVTVYSENKLVASKTVTLNDKEYDMVPFYTLDLQPGTYKIVVTTSDTKPYEVGTYFYE